jgi:hypothetical protein
MTVQKKHILIFSLAALVPVAGIAIYMSSGDETPDETVLSEGQLGEESAQGGNVPGVEGLSTGGSTGQAALAPQAEPKSSGGFFGFFKSKESAAPSGPMIPGGGSGANTGASTGAGSAATTTGQVEGAPSGLPGEFMGKGDTALSGDLAPKGPKCVSVEFKSKDASLKGKRHELVFQDALPSKKAVCIQVDGKSVSFEVASKGVRAIVDRKILRAKTKVTAIYCKNEKDCALKCPKIEEDFWDSVSAVSNEAEVTGFAGQESQEEKALQKELVALSEVLKSQPETPDYAQWVVASQRPVDCAE